VKPAGLDPVTKLLAWLLVFFTVVLISCDYVFRSEGHVFQVFSGMITGIGGALLVRVKPSPHDDADSRESAAQKPADQA